LKSDGDEWSSSVWVLCPQQKSLQDELDRRFGGCQGCSGYSGKEKNLFPLLGIKPIIQLTANNTE
jgi:hypothetical protein